MFEYLKKMMKPAGADEKKETRVSTEDIMADFGAAFEKPENLPTEEIARKGNPASKQGGSTT